MEVRMDLARIVINDASDQQIIILKERDLTRLGEGGLARGRLTVPAMRRATEILARYAAIMKRCGVDRVEAVATRRPYAIVGRNVLRSLVLRVHGPREELELTTARR